ncbi:unnamed protein product [Chrysoparadoxa australica]
MLGVFRLTTLIMFLSLQCSRAFRAAVGARGPLLGRSRMSMSTTGGVDEIKTSIATVGATIRSLKGDGADKAALQPHIDELLALKASYMTLTGEPFDPPKKGKSKSKGKGGAQKPKAQENKGQQSDKITPRSSDYSQWYLDVIAAAEMVDQSPVKGCMVIRPWGMAIWDNFREDMDRRIKDAGATNAYFPIFIPQSFLSKEAEHVEGFAKECAVVTHHRLSANPDGPGLIPDPEAKLEEPLVVRPTSETMIWHMLGKWISSHRDLPLKINQWANVVRWELRTRPFLRSAEFLWQEGHTAHSSSDEALCCAKEMLDVYADAAAEMLAVPVIKGAKSPKERFAGAEETFTIEALMQNGWALQSGTSHFLGQNFARAFEVYFQNTEEERELVWATSWGVSTRLMGALVMTHSDDAGLRMPPAVAPYQVVIVPILKGGEADKVVNAYVNKAVLSLKKSGIRVKVDDRPSMRPGAKYFEWERKGVPLRLEMGPRDAENNVVVVARRTGGDKATVPFDESFGQTINDELQEIHNRLWEEANERLQSHTLDCATYEEMTGHLESGDPARLGFYRVPWCCNEANEKAIQEECKATIRCYPTEENESGTWRGKTCFYSGEPATRTALFARAF